jgi:predicted amidohydrolase YtcJ
MPTSPELILFNGTIITLDKSNPRASAIAVKDGLFQAVGADADILKLAGADTQRIDLNRRTVIPGLQDNHIHIIRGGLNYNMELRWDGCSSLADAMAMLKAQVQVTPPPQWVRVVGGFTEHQFTEKRLPTLEEINQAAPDTPVFILHLYDRALLNQAALRACGYDRNTPEPPGGTIVRDTNGDPTGMLIAKPNAQILYATLAKGPKLGYEDQLNSSRHFMRELNRLGVTSVIDAGGGFQNYPDDYKVVSELAAQGQLTLRISYNLFTQNKGGELDDFKRWTGMVKPGDGDAMYRHNGAGEMLAFSAADFEDFREPRPDMAMSMEGDLDPVIRHLAANRWPFRLHATYEETISRALDVFEKVNRDVPFNGLHWFFDHAETVSPRSIDRIAALGGGIAVQHRMAYQGEYFVERYGARAAEATPPIARMLSSGVAVSAGTDATRVASYNPWVSLYWLVTGKTLAGLQLYRSDNTVDRETALGLWTQATTWFSNEEGKKGQIKTGQYADLAVPSADYLSVPSDQIKDLASILTIVGGRIVWADGDFKTHAPEPLPVSPSWSPVKQFGGYQKGRAAVVQRAQLDAGRPGVLDRVSGLLCGCAKSCSVHGHEHAQAWAAPAPASDLKSFWGALGCSCFM